MGAAVVNSESEPEVPLSRNRLLLAGCVGIFVELYDNGIFAFMATTLSLVFYPRDNSYAAEIFVFSGYAVSFFMRPLGAIVFGILGDRYGRKQVLVVVILLISAATAGIGFLPSYTSVGFAAPLLLFILRMVQGFSVGGEAAGAMTFLAEHSPPGKRGLYTSLAHTSSYTALLAGTTVAYAMSPWLTREAIDGGGFTSWAWRIPFLIAIPLGLIGFYIRHSLEDTPLFRTLKKEGRLSRNPLKEALSSRAHRRALYLALSVPLMNGSGYYVLFSYMPHFLSGARIGFDTGTALMVTASSLVVVSIAIPFLGALSDRVGRTRVIAGAALLMTIIAVPSYALIATGSFALALLGACLMAAVFAGHTAVIHVLIVELFPTRIRYSAYGLGYNISTALFGGTAPLVMTWLITETGSIYVPAYYSVVTAFITFLAVLTVKDRSREPLRDE